MLVQQAPAPGLISAYREVACEVTQMDRNMDAAAEPARLDCLQKLPKIATVIVARDRPDELERTVSAICAQEAAAELSLIIVDSSLKCSAMTRFGGQPGIQVIESQVNLGGAGGFALGILAAIAAGADWLWLMDDDGRPLDDTVLESLLAVAHARKLDAVAPMVLDADNLERFAFPYPIRNRYVFNRGELGADAFIAGTAHLFNGLLIRAQAIFRIGLPDLRLFIRGDEIDFLHRMRRAKLAFGTTALARFAHPSSNKELFPVFGGRLHVVYPEPRWKRRNQYRNRAYNFLTHGMLLILAVDFLRYPYFFLLKRGWDWRGLREWLACTWEGVRGDVHVEPMIDLSPRERDLSRP